MPVTMNHVATVAAVAAIALSGTALLRSTTVSSRAPAELPPGSPPTPPPCRQACDTLADMCGEKRWTNCESFIGRYAASDAGWTCAQPITPDVLKGLGLERCSK